MAIDILIPDSKYFDLTKNARARSVNIAGRTSKAPCTALVQMTNGLKSQNTYALRAIPNPENPLTSLKRRSPVVRSPIMSGSLTARRRIGESIVGEYPTTKEIQSICETCVAKLRGSTSNDAINRNGK